MGKIITISAVSGAGKDFFIGNLLKKFSSLYFSESETTRLLTRRDQSSTKKYTHISEEDFKKNIEENYFLEWGKSHLNYYGTPKSSLRKAFYSKKDLLLEIDVKKATDLLKQKDFELDFVPKGFFLWRDIHPLSNFRMSELINSVKENIRSRETIDEKSLRDRLNSALSEYSTVKKNAELFTFIENVNNDPEAAINQFSKKYISTFYPA